MEIVGNIFMVLMLAFIALLPAFACKWTRHRLRAPVAVLNMFGLIAAGLLSEASLHGALCLAMMVWTICLMILVWPKLTRES